MRKTMITLAAAAALGLAGTALAESKSGASRMFQKIDTNHDGVISAEEARAAQARRFARLDADGDGVISREEFQARAERRFTRLDRDGDGAVSREEIDEARREWREKKSD